MAFEACCDTFDGHNAAFERDDDELNFYWRDANGLNILALCSEDETISFTSEGTCSVYPLRMYASVLSELNLPDAGGTSIYTAGN